MNKNYTNKRYVHKGAIIMMCILKFTICGQEFELNKFTLTKRVPRVREEYGW